MRSIGGLATQPLTAKRRAILVLDIVKGKTSAAEVARQHGLTVAEVDTWAQRLMHGIEELLKT